MNEKIAFAFELYDTDGTGTLKAPDLSFILTSMNNVASYFGDPVMASEQVSRQASCMLSFQDNHHPTGTVLFSQT